MAMRPDDVFKHRARLAVMHRDAYRQLCSTAEGREETTLAIANTSYETAESTVRRKKKKKLSSKVRIYQPKANAEAQDPNTGVWWPVNVVSQDYSTGSARVRTAEDSTAPEWSTQSLRKNPKPSKRTPLKHFPKGRSIWSEDHSKAVVLSNTDTNNHKTEDPSYLTPDRLYAMYVDLKQKNRLLESNLSQTKSELRSHQVKAASHVDDLLRQASPAVTYRITSAHIKPNHVRNMQDMHNVIIRQQSADLFDIRGGSRECLQCVTAIKNLYPEALVVKEEESPDIAVDDAVRVISIQKTGFISSIDKTSTPPMYTVRHGSIDGGIEINIYPQSELELLASPVLWCTALKVSLPVTDTAHVVLLKKEIRSLKSKCDRTTQLATQRRSGQRQAQEDNFKEIADQVDKYNERLDGISYDKEQLQISRADLSEAKSKISELEQTLKEVRENAVSTARTLRVQLSEEKATRLRVEDSLTMEGLWGTVSDSSKTISGSKMIEIVAKVDPYSNKQTLVYSEVLSGKEIHGTLNPTRVTESSPVISAEYHAVLSNDSEIWLGRTDPGNISITYREPGGLSRQHTFTKVLFQLGDNNPCKLPAMVAGSCPRCHATTTETPTENSSIPAPANRGFRNSEVQTVESISPSEGLETKIRELQTSLVSKDRELQTAVDALKIRDVSISSPTADQNDPQSAELARQEKATRERQAVAEKRREEESKAAELARREQNEENKRKLQQAETARQQAEAESKKQKEAEEKLLQEEAAKKAHREQEERQRAEADAKRKKETEDKARQEEERQRAEQEAKKLRVAEEEAERKREEDAKKQKDAEDKARQQAEEEERQRAEAETRKQEEIAFQEEEERQRAEAVAKQQKEAEDKARQEEQERVEQEAKKQKEEEEALLKEKERQHAEAEAKKQKEADEEADRLKREKEDAKQQQQSTETTSKKSIVMTLSSVDKSVTPHLALLSRAFEN